MNPLAMRPMRTREEAIRLLELRVWAHLPGTVPAIAAAIGVSQGATRVIMRRLRQAGDVRVVSRVPINPNGQVWGRRYIAVYDRARARVPMEHTA